jgi:predicted dehydrogenase
MKRPFPRPRIAVIGCGYWGKNLVRNFYELDALSLVCDLTEAGRALASHLAPDCRVARDVAEVWDSDADGVVIATPAVTHHDLALEALRAGKHVFVEKPLALSYDQGLDIVHTAEAMDRRLMVGHVLEYHPAIVALHSLVDSGRLGKLRYIYSNRLSLGKIRREENILWSFAPHDIAIIVRLLQSMPFEVCACGGSYVQANIPDVTVTQLLFDHGVRAHIHVSWLHPFKEQRLVVIGSAQMASFDDIAKKLVIYDQHVELRGNEPVPVRNVGVEVPFASDEPLRLECEAFLRSIESGDDPLTNGWSALRVLRVMQAAERSLVTNGWPTAVQEEVFA